MITYIGTANPGFAPYAMEELRKRIPGTSVSGLAPGETFRFTSGGVPSENLLADFRRNEPVFLRHLFPVEADVPLTADAEETAVSLRAYAESLKERVAGRKVAIQVRKSHGSPFPYSSAEGRDIVAEIVHGFGSETVARDADLIVSVYAAHKTLFFGCSTPKDNLSDWPGGAVRFRREDELISRAAFKLLEAEQSFRLPLDRFTSALDLGAAPGGWTSVLLERGLKVTAVDPAELDPSLEGAERLRHLRSNAADVTFPAGSFDLLVCDMSWDPYNTAKLVTGLAPALTAGASGIVTLKLMYRKPFHTLQELVKAYEETFEIKKIKQLFHNREEVTMWVRKKY